MNSSRPVPFLDLVTPHADMRSELVGVFEAALDTAGFIGGPMVQNFESAFAAYCGVEHCVGVGSGTDALRFILMAIGVESGDVVITVPNTFIATSEAISQAGGRPVFVDIDEATYNMDPVKLRRFIDESCRYDAQSGKLFEKKTNARVAAVIPVHLFGQPAEMDQLLAIATEFNLTLIEDACQAHGAEYFSAKENRWMAAGSMGRAAAFSFYPGKNLGACGEAGAVTTNDPELAQKIRMLRDHGQIRKYYHDIEGFNGRLDAVQAGILHVKLKHLPGWTELRRAAASRYRELLAGEESRVKLPSEPAWCKSVYHLFVVRVDGRDEVIRHLNSVKIGTGIHYPIPLHLQRAYDHLGYKQGDLPVAEFVASELLSLPMFPGLQPEAQDYVVNELLLCTGAARPALLES